MFSTGVRRILDSLDGMSCSGCFTSAEDALDELDHDGAPPDVILLDVQLPGIDGISALAPFHEKAPKAQIIILTVFDDADKIFNAVCTGASGYVLKSAGIDTIGNSIRQVMADGLGKKEIAEALEISIHTVSTHMRRVYTKLHVGTNTGAVAKALREGII